MNDDVTPAAGRRATGLILAGHALLIIAYALDFHLDVRGRDVLSWMDPYQYYDFALGVLSGSERLREFEVPSIFPFLLMPALSLDASIPAALWTNVAFTILLVASVHGLCRELSIGTPSPLVALLILSSPLLIGLSRTTYVEYALSAVVALAFWLWLGFLRSGRERWGVGFALVFGLGFMLKMTFPLFFVLPVAAALLERLSARRPRDVYAISAVTLVPLTFVLIVQAAFFPRSFAYYLSFGNTAMPIMRLIGPPDWLSWSSATYYLGEMGRTLTFLLTPFVALAAIGTAVQRLRSSRTALSGAKSTLWLWLLGPLLLLILQPVKEPRHIAPCVVPAVLLGVLWIEGLSGRAMRSSLLWLATSLAVVQIAVVTTGRIETPYFLDRPLHWEAIRDGMIRSRNIGRYQETPEAWRLLHWKYDQNVAIDGFSPNEALALTWQLFPGVVFDLTTFDEPERLSDRIPYARFEDLYILTAFNSYNRRCGWRSYYDTLTRESVVAHADFVIADAIDREEAARRFPGHEPMLTIDRAGGPIQILRARRRTTAPYRGLYAEAFLKRHPDLSEDERRLVATEMLAAALLGGYDERARLILDRHPTLADPERGLRNIHWIAGYDVINRLVSERVARISGP